MSPEVLTEQGQQGFGTVVSASSDGKQDGLISATFLKWASRLLLAYFGVRLVFFALDISSFVPPDEVTHAGLCKAFSKVLLIPDNSPATYEFGLVTNMPWLYYWVMGKLLQLNFIHVSDLVFLRLLNIPLAFATVFFVRSTLSLLTRDRLTQLLLVVVITNTAMFSLLSASVSCDNLVTLLAAMSIYYLLAFFTYRSGRLLACSILCQLAGSLTKVSFLPVALVLDVLLLGHELMKLHALPAALKAYLHDSGFKDWLLILLIIITLGLGLQLYGDNYLRFGHLAPTMSDIFPDKIAQQYRIVARETIFREYSEGRISYWDAIIMAGEIKHPGDKADTFYLLMNYENLKRNPDLWLKPLPYAKVWFEGMVGTIIGIKGHLPMLKSPWWLIPIYFVMAFSLLGFCVRWRPHEGGWLPLCLVLISCCYAGILLCKVNYNAYLYYGTPGITLQGRYLFPVIGPIYCLLCYYLTHLIRARYIRFSLALFTALLFISYDFPWFLMHATREWFSWLPQ